jgi:hypothetical protein
LLIGTGFQSSGYGRSYGDNPFARDTGIIDCLGGLRINLKNFWVQAMIFDPLVLNRQEGADSHMERQRMNRNSFPLDLIQKRFREMQTRRWGRDGSFLAGINGLVTFYIPSPHCPVAIPPNVRGQGWKPNPSDGSIHIPPATQAEAPETMGISLQEFRAQLLLEIHRRLAANLARTLHQAFPLAGRLPSSPVNPGRGVHRPFFPYQDDLYFPPALLFPDQAGGPDFGVIDHQDIPRLKVFRQLAKVVVSHRLSSPVQNHQP